jgi:hypothetical protein
VSTQKPSPAENVKLDVPHAELIPISHHDALNWLTRHAGHPATVHIRVHLGDRSMDVLSCEGVLTAGRNAAAPVQTVGAPACATARITVGASVIDLTELAGMPVATAGTNELHVDLDTDCVLRIVARPGPPTRRRVGEMESAVSISSPGHSY